MKYVLALALFALGTLVPSSHAQCEAEGSYPMIQQNAQTGEKGFNCAIMWRAPGNLVLPFLLIVNIVYIYFISILELLFYSCKVASI